MAVDVVATLVGHPIQLTDTDISGTPAVVEFIVTVLVAGELAEDRIKCVLNELV
jgi:hypothetical protein